ncbi:hypothetical protein KM043_003161 [Ampulex compressa]|nr:hypothetical protein KM043_003161 [Ampulex compressa]
MIKLLLLLSTLLLCSWCAGQGILGANWLQGLHENIDRMNRNINENVRHLNRQIQENVQKQLKQVDELRKNINATGQQRSTLVVGNNGGVYVNGAGGSTRWIYSGQGEDSRPYYRDVEERIVGSVLHRTERVRNPETKGVHEYRYTLDLSDPKAKPVPVEDNN